MFSENLLKNRLKWHNDIFKSYEGTSLYNFFPYTKIYSPQEIKNYWQIFIKDPKNRDRLNLLNFYIHIPFCQSKCAYCMYPSWPLNNQKKIDQYINYLIQNFQFFHRVFAAVKFRNLYIGGGTPSILNLKQINKLFSYLFQYFSFEKKGQKTIECNPLSTDLKKLYLFKKFGVNRISFGVQSTSSKVLQINNRSYQNYTVVRKAISWAKKVSFSDINVDLMVNLAGDKPDYFLKSFSDIAKLQPHSIVIYSLLPTTRYCRDFLKCTKKEYYKNYPKTVAPFLKMMKIASHKFGYCTPEPINPSRFNWGFRKKNTYSFINPLKQYGGEFVGRIPFSCFGLGFFSRSHIQNLLEYRQNKIIYHFNPEEKVYEGRKFSKKEEMIRFVIDSIEKDSKVSQRAFQKLFKTSLVDNFFYVFNILKKLKKIKITNDFIYFLLRNFKERFLYLAFFFNKKTLKKMLKNQNEIKINREDKKNYSSKWIGKINDREMVAKEKKYWVRLTRACNNHCIFCLDKEAQNGTYLSLEIIKKELKKGRDLGIKRVILSGGEPTIHPQFLKIVKIAKDLGYQHIQVITNGRMFAYQDFLDSTIKAGVSEITFSIHGHNEKLHDQQTQVRGSFKQSLKGLVNALKISRLIVSVDIVINKLNYKYLADILRFLIFLGVKEFDLLQIIPFGRAWDNKEKVLYNTERALPYLKKAFELSKNPSLFIWTNRLLAKYLEDFEELIQHPIKIYDEIKGREELFEAFLKKNKIMDCYGPRCQYCFLENFCQNLIEFKEKRFLEAKRLPLCLSNFGEVNFSSQSQLKFPVDIYQFTDFYINFHYFVKSLRCKKCQFNKNCFGAPINFIREKGFSILKPIKNNG